MSALESGIMLLPFITSYTITSIVARSLVTWIGYYPPFMILGSVLMAIGIGLLTSLTVSASGAA